MAGLAVSDPTYVEDFWITRGYAGADGHVRAGLVDTDATVSAILRSAELITSLGPNQSLATRLVARFVTNFNADAPIGVRLDGVDASNLTCATMTFTAGAAQGRSVITFLVLGDILIPAGEGAFFDAHLLDGVAPGDTVRIDNRAFIAYCHRHRYTRGNEVVDPFALADLPVYPVREETPLLTGGFSGDFGAAKMILVMHVLDRPCWPTAGVRYHRGLVKRLADQIDDHFRLWWSANATHIPSVWEGGPISTLTIDYTGIIAQAIRDVITWVEQGLPPAPSATYDWRDGQLIIPGEASRTGGIQPVVRATANGAPATRVAVGELVRLEFTAEPPPGTGAIVAAEWDFDGTGTWVSHQAGTYGRSGLVSESIEHSWASPGTYFATVRVRAHRDGNAEATTHLVENLARVRVVVE
jgi:hypothetical protein